MTTPANTDHCDICEAAIREKQAYNRDHKIFPGMNEVGDRLLRRRPEMRDAYAELCRKLGSDEVALKVFFDLLLGTADIWCPEQVADARMARDRLKAVNEEIKRQANALVRLLEERDSLHGRSGFSADTHYHPLDLIEQAAAKNFLHGSFVKDDLVKLRRRYDLKYWPSISGCMQALACDAAQAAVRAHDPITAAATSGARNSLADFLRTLFAAIEQNSHEDGGFLPRDFRLTDATLASFMNCALDLGPDNMIDAEYVKRMRQRERERATDVM